jgi:hypothetical protein
MAAKTRRRQKTMKPRNAPTELHVSPTIPNRVEIYCFTPAAAESFFQLIEAAASFIKRQSYFAARDLEEGKGIAESLRLVSRQLQDSKMIIEKTEAPAPAPAPAP